VATRDATWTKWNTDWWERQATHGGLVAGGSLAFFHLAADALIHGRDATIQWLRLAAAIILGPETLDPAMAPEPAVVTGSLIHLTFSAAFGTTFGSLVARYRQLRRSLPILAGAAALYAVLVGLVNVYSIAPFVGWHWFPELMHPLVLVIGHGLFFGVPLALYLHVKAAPRRRLGMH
jgi:hypothetical protein